ncbi:ribosome biogenesis protein [Candidatus Woesearchaeota archaeon]|nr:ribosome biogenesis protein [Candidatus Woesearchaeota archaeon]
MKHILKCAKCGIYTMKDICSCGNAAASPRPMKYSPNDRFMAYRRKSKLEEYFKRGLV